MKKVFTLIFILITLLSGAQVRISQVYGGGGNASATYNQDFVELFNAGTTTVSIGGWSVQYASAAGTTAWGVYAIPAGSTIGPGNYFLIAMASGATGIALPTPDGTGALNLSGTAGKVALVSNTTALIGSSGCANVAVLDVIGYGSTANCSETAVFPTTGITNAQSIFRNSGGCTDANNNSTDFSIGTVVPRNSASTPNSCGADITPPVVTTLIPSDNAINISTNSDLSILFNENIIKGASGNIYLRRISDNVAEQTIDVTSPLVTINGGNTANIDIATLTINTAYYIEIDSGTFEDVAGNDFAGISGNSIWNFTTIPLPAAGIVGNNYSFTSCAGTFITEGWRQYSVTGTQTWACTASGRTGADGIEMNAFVSAGNSPLNEDWLISPPFDLTSTTAPTLKFYSNGNFTPGNGLTVKVSNNYTPGQNPNLSTWNDILVFPAPTSNSNTTWLLNDNIDLAAYNMPNVFIAWHYNNPITATSSRWRIDDVTIYSNIVLPPCDEPTDQPTNLALTPTATTVIGSFTATVPAPSGYLVVRSMSPTLSANPVDGTTYTLGAALGGGVVVANGSATSFTDNGLAPTTLYYYYVFAYNNENCTGGANYNVALNSPNGNTNSTTTLALAPCVEPSNAPTTLNLSATNTTISGSFTASATANRYLVVISASTPLGATPADGTTYTAGSAFGAGTVVYYGANTTFNATGLIANTPYFIFVFAANGDCTGEPDYFTTSLDGTISTTNGTGVPAGYYDDAADLTCQPLKTALKNIISTGTQVLSYTPGLWNLYHFSDKRRNDANTADILWDTYTDIPTGPEFYTFTLGTNQCGSYVNEGDCYNREHSTPQSWFNSASPMVSDAHHIFPTDGKINALHSNFPYGEVQMLVSPSAFNPSTNGSKLGTDPVGNYGYASTVFEPIDEYKGDYARAFLYMAVRYQDEIISQNWSGNSLGNEVYLSVADSNDVAFRTLQIYDNWFLKLLYKWHIQDPVSAKEINRNNVIYSQLITDGAVQKKQGNRNPFVDHPEYVAAIWGPSCLTVLPVTITNLSAKKVNNNALISWKVSNEQSINKYQIERSTTSINFEKIGEVNSNSNSIYSFTDNNLPKTQRVYYRIKTIELSGKTTVTNIVSVEGNATSSTIKIYPNPAAEFVSVELNNINLNEASILSITDITGKVVLQRSFTPNSSFLKIPVQQFGNGVYTLKISNSLTTIYTKFVIAK